MRLSYTRFYGDTINVVSAPNQFQMGFFEKNPLCLVKKELKIIRHKVLSEVYLWFIKTVQKSKKQNNLISNSQEIYHY